MFPPVFVVNLEVLGVLDDVRDVVEPAVGYGGAKVGKVQRSASKLALTYGQGYDCEGFPSSLAVMPVVIGRPKPKDCT